MQTAQKFEVPVGGFAPVLPDTHGGHEANLSDDVFVKAQPVTSIPNNDATILKSTDHILIGTDPVDGSRTYRVTITPIIAQLWLDAMTLHSSNVRAPNRQQVGSLAVAMRQGKFSTTSQGITLDNNGLVRDGGNRLSAIVKSNVTLTLRVYIGDFAWANYDGVRKRSLADIVRGSTNDVALFNFMFMEQFIGVTVNAALKVGPFEIVREAIETVNSWFFKKSEKRITAPVIAPIVRAYLGGHDVAKLQEFCKILLDQTDYSSAVHQPISILLKYLRSNECTNDTSGRIQTYKKTEKALKAFLDGEKLVANRLYPALTELFPLELDKVVAEAVKI